VNTPSVDRAWYLRLEWLLVWASFALFATIRAPIPGINEPHYFTKAKHFWDPAWCSRDPFLQSANAHYIFYATFGALTKFLTLTQSAWIGRVLGWGLLASGWCALASQFSRLRGFGLWSAWVFLGLASLYNWSGEWVVGGIEAKVISYACVWWSLASLISGKRIHAAGWAGVAVSFHPVVGIWHTGAAMLAMLSTQRVRYWVAAFRSIVVAGIVWSVCATPGLIPAIAMIREANPDDAYAADYLQVFHRLSHHLDPLKFHLESHIFYGILIGLVIVAHVVIRWRSRQILSRNNGQLGSETSGRPANGVAVADQANAIAAELLLFRYVMIAVFIALAGLTLRASPKIADWLLKSNALPALQNRLTVIVKSENHLAKWLKFYPFRLADVVVPLALAMQSTYLLTRFVTGREPGTGAVTASAGRALIPWLVFAIVSTGTVFNSIAATKNDARLKPELFPDWRDTCQWLRSETPVDSMCFAPSQAFGLKWYAERAEYVSHKDCPQDAAGIVAWNKRFLLIGKWSRQLTSNGYTKQMVRELHKSTGIDYIITPIVGSKLGRFPIQPVYQNESYQVFRLVDAE
jgi:hypothetical protein